ncbi:hypothetical protein [Levilactobacillus brevis]|uniref:Uncharacterized protein n=1 Tax=Levilactobacillus brevis TaxID=1580 RepID=A0A0C1M9Y4_LEVBR|nr:hypothetical protein [Levilactobacillus brevis]AJA81443.1 hypothetical protein L747_13395 [Levilactobacillus brevis BSO 464]KID43724.1 hypothetical protein LbDm2_1891 [Levilactobacillus brevis]KIO94220.1 hypothetical protein N624_0334 [Levilactobacillus brevis]MBS0947246.1 hypothetical protein [Levilactobacillus brevis]MBS0978467.1 hypothetical protein [Levilactobacillus brevis]
MGFRDIATLLGALGSFAMVIWSIVHAHTHDKRQAEQDRTKWEKWIMAQVKTNSEEALANMQNKLYELQRDFDNLSSEKEHMANQYEQQISSLRQANAILRQENDKYHAKYGNL